MEVWWKDVKLMWILREFLISEGKS